MKIKRSFTHDFTAIKFGRIEHGHLERIYSRSNLLIQIVVLRNYIVAVVVVR